MTYEELEEALQNKKSITFEGKGYLSTYGPMEYLCVSAIIREFENGKFKITARLMDKNQRNAIIANPEDIKFT